MVFYEASEQSVKNELKSERTESTRLGQFFDDVREEVADLQEKMGAWDALFDPSIKICVPHLSHLSRTWLIISVRGFIKPRTEIVNQVPERWLKCGTQKSVSEALCAGSV